MSPLLPFARLPRRHALPSLLDQFGVRSSAQVRRDLAQVASEFFAREGFLAAPSTLGFVRPDLSLPAYAGLYPTDGVSPIYHLFDRVGGGKGYRQAITRDRARDYRGGRLTYDEHDGVDFVCPRGTPVAAAAPGVLVATRDNWLRGGLTACIDHGGGVVTQYTHLTGLLVDVGQPLERGQSFALSGVAGLDMLSGAPWVPPHVHFMVWQGGSPIDPYTGPGEPAPLWAHLSGPHAADGPLPDDPSPDAVARSLEASIDEAAVDNALRTCRSPALRAEIESAPTAAARVAILEDALHHDRRHFPSGATHNLRRGLGSVRPRLTLPLTSELYRTALPADAPWTRPTGDHG